MSLKRFRNKQNIYIARWVDETHSKRPDEIDSELSYAILTDNIQLVEELLNEGAIASYRFIYAIKRYMDGLYDKDDIIKLLLERGENVNVRDSHDNMKSGLHIVIEKMYLNNNKGFELLTYLLEKGARMDIRDDDGNTPLHYCAKLRENIDKVMCILNL